MVAARTSDDLLTRVRARALVPETDGRLTDSDILAIADDVILSTLSRAIVNADDGRWVKTRADAPITVGTAEYRIPDRALGAALYDVLIVDERGLELSSPYVDSSEAWRYSGASRGAGPAPYDHTIEGDLLRLLPTPSQHGHTLRIKYRRRPSRLVTTAECARISGIAGTLVTTAATVPSGWSSSETLDIVQASPNADALGDDLAGSSIAGTSITLASVPAEARTGDYVCRAGETCVPQVPDVAIPALVALTAVEVMIALGDAEGAAALRDIAVLRVQEARKQLATRNREAQAVIPRWSALRGGGGARRWRR